MTVSSVTLAARRATCHRSPRAERGEEGKWEARSLERRAQTAAARAAGFCTSACGRRKVTSDGDENGSELSEMRSCQASA